MKEQMRIGPDVLTRATLGLALKERFHTRECSPILCLYEFESLHLHPVSKEMLSVPHHHRRDHEPILIDEVKLLKGVDQIATADHHDIPITLLLQPGYFLGKIAMKQS